MNFLKTTITLKTILTLIILLVNTQVLSQKIAPPQEPPLADKVKLSEQEITKKKLKTIKRHNDFLANNNREIERVKAKTSLQKAIIECVNLGDCKDSSFYKQQQAQKLLAQERINQQEQGRPTNQQQNILINATNKTEALTTKQKNEQEINSINIKFIANNVVGFNGLGNFKIGDIVIGNWALKKITGKQVIIVNTTDNKEIIKWIVL